MNSFDHQRSVVRRRGQARSCTWYRGRTIDSATDRALQLRICMRMATVFLAVLATACASTPRGAEPTSREVAVRKHGATTALVAAIRAGSSTSIEEQLPGMLLRLAK